MRERLDFRFKNRSESISKVSKGCEKVPDCEFFLGMGWGGRWGSSDSISALMEEVSEEDLS